MNIKIYNMEVVDLTLLEKVPELNKSVILEIQPLAPLSMVDELPGSFYKTMKSPSKKMLSGLFENILEWHIDAADRKQVVNEIKKLRKKQKLEFPEYNSGSNYIPLLMEYFEIRLPLLPTITNHYDDLWTRAFRRTDSFRHTNNSRYMEAGFVEKWRDIKKSVSTNEKRSNTEKNALLDRLFKRYQNYFPMYYGTPTIREYIFLNGNYQIKLSIDRNLYELLKFKLSEANLTYLGSSEGWINVEFKEIEI